jgi:heme/copper-type cytochrome/quinol oxidase subunit 2
MGPDPVMSPPSAPKQVKVTRIFSSCLIILVSIVLVAWVTYTVASRRTPPRNPPTRLPDPPVKAEVLVGITSAGFYSAVPIIRAIDEQLYSYDYSGPGYTWGSGSLPEETHDWPCDVWSISQIEAAGGKIVDCRMSSTSGEFCPGPDVSFALTANGEIWQQIQLRTCPLDILITVVPIFALVGLLIGIVIVVLINLLRRFKFKR